MGTAELWDGMFTLAPRRTPGTPPNGAAASAPLLAWVADIVRPPAGSGSTGLSGALRQVRRHFLNALLFSAIISVLYLSSSIYMMLVYDKVLNSGSFVTLAMITLALVFALGSKDSSRYEYWEMKVDGGVRFTITGEYIESAPGLKPLSFTGTVTGSAISGEGMRGPRKSTITTSLAT